MYYCLNTTIIVSIYLVNKNPEIKKIISRLTSIPGVGTLTALTVLAEKNGFELIRNKAQLSSYAGLDVREKQSGTSILSKPRISKKGNRHLRKSLYLASLTAVKGILILRKYTLG